MKQKTSEPLKVRCEMEGKYSADFLQLKSLRKCISEAIGNHRYDQKFH